VQGLNTQRILFVNHSSKLGGAEIVLSAVAPLFKSDSAIFLFEDGPLRLSMQDEGLRVILSKQQKDISGIKRDTNLLKVVVPLLGSLSAVVGEIARLAKNFDVIYANSQKAFVLSALASIIKRKKLIWHLHDILSREHFSKAQISLAVRLANAQASCVIVPSSATRKAFIAAGGKAKLVKVVHNGVKFPHVDSSNDLAVERALVGIPTSFVYGVFSRLARWKGQHVAIEALQYVNDASCVIVGDAQFGEQDYASSLKALAEQLGVQDRVIFLGHRNDVPKLMSLVDVYVHPSISPEPFSLALLEAMHAGLPIVASNAGGVPEAITSGVTGFLATPGSAKDLAKYIRIFQNDPPAAKQLGSNAFAVATEEFSVSQMQSKILAVIESLRV
jgi:glycosyltransferase involved in cell wall biosynthesis